MTKMEASVLINRPVEDVWKFISDWSNAPKWMPGALEVKQTSAGPLGVGATLESRWQSKRLSKGASRVTEYEPGRKITLYNTAPQMIRGSRESLGLENVEGKTKLNSACEWKFNGIYRLVGPSLVGRLRKSNEAMVSNVKRIMESEAKA
jgi:uncharacterized protein YndB with AHSA1/START domain